MLVQIPQVLTQDEVAYCRRRLQEEEWVDGRVTAGDQSAKAKFNLQIPENSPVSRELGELILQALGRSPLFTTAALPLRVFPPLFNRYEGGQEFGNHIDNAVRRNRGDLKVRTDLSATLFLSEPEEYDGGELVVEDTYGGHAVKLGAGDLILYPASSLHRVEPVTRGARIASFFWIQSMVRDDGARALMFDLDMAVQHLAARVGQGDPQIVALTGIYHNLLRRWAEI